MKMVKTAGLVVLVSSFFASEAFAATSASNARDVIWQGLMGAGVGAISAEVSGGKAGKGALIGAGTHVLGTALMGLLTGPSDRSSYYSQPVYPQPSYSQPTYSQPAYSQPTYYQTQTTYVPVQQQVIVRQPVVYRQSEPVYVHQPVYSAPVYRAPDYEDPNRHIIKQGLMGAGVGAISSYAPGGKGGSGALIGAGTNVIGTALLELLTQ